jgi:hypothetical protein
MVWLAVFGTATGALLLWAFILGIVKTIRWLTDLLGMRRTAYCPYCKEPMRPDATVCPSCQRTLQRQITPPLETSPLVNQEASERGAVEGAAYVMLRQALTEAEEGRWDAVGLACQRVLTILEWQADDKVPPQQHRV